MCKSCGPPCYGFLQLTLTTTYRRYLPHAQDGEGKGRGKVRPLVASNQSMLTSRASKQASETEMMKGPRHVRFHLSCFQARSLSNPCVPPIHTRTRTQVKQAKGSKYIARKKALSDVSA